jgi:hypothetical protein
MNNEVIVAVVQLVGHEKKSRVLRKFRRAKEGFGENYPAGFLVVKLQSPNHTVNYLQMMLA